MADPYVYSTKPEAAQMRQDIVVPAPAGTPEAVADEIDVDELLGDLGEAVLPSLQQRVAALASRQIDEGSVDSAIDSAKSTLRRVARSLGEPDREFSLDTIKTGTWVSLAYRSGRIAKEEEDRDYDDTGKEEARALAALQKAFPGRVVEAAHEEKSYVSIGVLVDRGV